MRTDTSKHPCFNRESAGSCGRVHLPVAPKCNIQCGYCNRKYDCVNETRPGVTSAVLAPAAAAAYMDKVLEAEPRITVAGIAGPGDPMANPEETLATLRMLKQKHPQLLFCLSSNGLALPQHVDELAGLGVTHVTVTVNAVDPEIGAKIYTWARDGKIIHRGRAAAELLIARQLESIRRLKEKGILVKVNTIVIPGVNDAHAEEVARTVAGLGADIHNLIPLHPNPETALASVPEPSKELINSLRAACGEILPQMTHCRRCRADAVGLLHQDRSSEFAPCLRALEKDPFQAGADRPYVAVGTMEGMLVNLHLGEAHAFQIWGQKDGTFARMEERFAPEPGTPDRWDKLAEVFRDCRAVLVSAAGETPRKALAAKGVAVHQVGGFIPTALEAVYGKGDLSALAVRRKGAVCCGGTGGGEGCGG